MKIVLVTQHFPPDFEGGTEVVVRAQARALLELGHEVRVIAGSDRLLSEGHTELRRGRVDGIDVTWVPHTAQEPYALVLARPRVLDHVLREARGADVCHVHHWSTLDGGLVRCLSESVPVVVTLHDHFTSCPRFFRRPPADLADLEDLPSPACPRGPGVRELRACVRCVGPDLPGYHERALERRLALRSHGYREELAAAARVIAPSRARAESACRLTGLARARIEVVPHGLCRSIARAQSPQPYHRDRKLVVLHFGNLCAEKGTLDLMQSLALLPSGSVELRLAGRSLDSGFDALVRSFGERLPIRRADACEPTELREFACGADLAAFPSRLDESYGLVVDEALALGLPVWLSRGTAAEQRLAEWGAGARSLPAEQPDAWSAAFRDLREDPDSLAEQRARVPGQLPTARDAAHRLSAIYEALLAGEPA